MVVRSPRGLLAHILWAAFVVQIDFLPVCRKILLIKYVPGNLDMIFQRPAKLSAGRLIELMGLLPLGRGSELGIVNAAGVL
jgi:hypothetical protein